MITLDEYLMYRTEYPSDGEAPSGLLLPTWLVNFSSSDGFLLLPLTVTNYAPVRRLRAIRLLKRMCEGYMGCIAAFFLLFGPLSLLHSRAQLSSESTRNRQGAISGIYNLA